MTLTKQKTELLIIGGGIVGLWCAYKAAQRKITTVLVEKNTIGSGASGGFLGALMPHQPIRWNEKKNFQLEALLSLETEIEALEKKTGLDCGYQRCGRLIPIRNTEKLRQSQTYQAAATDNWPSASPNGNPLDWRVLPNSPDPTWIDPELCPLGCDFDTLSARVNPRSLLEVLKSAAEDHVLFIEKTEALALMPNGHVQFSNGQTLDAPRVIIANGYESFSLAQQQTNGSLGFGVKGQAILVRPKHAIDTTAPIIYDGGLYIIAHHTGLVAIGSTSETSFDHPTQTTSAIKDVFFRAQKLCPSLADSEVVETWAAVRPKATARDPVIGKLPHDPCYILASGGFKITFGIAHLMAEAALDIATDRNPKLPSTFAIDHHLKMRNADNT